MLVVFLKSVFTFILVLIVIRIMGKRQLGEMQPFELVITLIIAEVACIPMNDPYIPFYCGIVPIITLAALHLIMSFISRKSIKARRVISGRSIIAIDKNGINYENLQKMNLNVNDLIEAVRSSGYIDFNEIEYAIFETNGKICIVEKATDPMKPKPALLPVSLYIDGYWEKENLALAQISEKQVTDIFAQNGYKNAREILYADIRQDGTVYVSPKRGACFTGKLELAGGANW